LAAFHPVDPRVFGFLLQVMIGPEGAEGEESFDIKVCSPLWLIERHNRDDVIVGRHHLILFEYDYERLKRTIQTYCGQWEAPTWSDLAVKLSRVGRWEFEDYAQNDPSRPVERFSPR
jgi:hypothetical protein